MNSNLIKGYHYFKVRPSSDVEMNVGVEEDNSYDPYSMIVTMPLLQNIHAELHDQVTRQKRKSEEEQHIRDIAGKIVGRVPANLCKLFRRLLKDREVFKITCWSVDSPRQKPSPQQSFRRNFKGKDRRGGGCRYPWSLSSMVLSIKS